MSIPKFLLTRQHGNVLARWRIDSPSVTELTDEHRNRAERNMRELVARGIAEVGYYDLELRNGANVLDSENRTTAEDVAVELLKKPEVQQVQIVTCELSEDEKHDETEEQQ